MKYYMQIDKPSDAPLTSNDLHKYSEEGWDLVAVKPNWTRQSLGKQVSSGPIPKFETWIFSKESKL